MNKKRIELIAFNIPFINNENYQNNPCADRESNPGQMLGRHLCYHYTIGADGKSGQIFIYNYIDLRSTFQHNINIVYDIV